MISIDTFTLSMSETSMPGILASFSAFTEILFFGTFIEGGAVLTSEINFVKLKSSVNESLSVTFNIICPERFSS